MVGLERKFSNIESAGSYFATLRDGRLRSMIIDDRLRDVREQKNLSQGDIERETGLLRCYISRVECGHTVPAMETLEKFARALGVRWCL